MPKHKLIQARADWGPELYDKYVRNVNDERAVLEGCRVNEAGGLYVCDFFRTYLRHSKGKWAGEPFELAPWERDGVVMPLFSWIRPDGRRRFTKVYIWIAKKNGKSSFGAGLLLYGLIADGEQGAECYNAAVDRKQAGIVFGVAHDMIQASSRLADKLEVIASQKVIRVRDQSNAWMRALSADVDTSQGLNAHFRMLDEVHVYDDRRKRLYESLEYAGSVRDQPLGIVTSTAGDDLIGFGHELYEISQGVRDGTHEDTVSLVCIAEADKGDDPGDEAAWEKANPMLDVTIKRDEMRASYNEARQKPRKMATFRRYRLNQWIDSSADPWLPLERWDECADEFSEGDLLGRECWGGLDVATRLDFNAFALCFPPTDDDPFYWFLVRFWLPEYLKSGGDIVERGKKDQAPYPLWVEQGWIDLTTGSAIDFSYIEDGIADIAKRFALKEVGYDPRDATQLVLNLQDQHGISMVEMQQGMLTMSAPSKKFETLIVDGDMRHNGNPVLRAQAARVTVKTDTRLNILPQKQDGKRRYRIDGIVACIMALGRAMAGDDHTSVYETRRPLLV
jgi:phage terminase large subunit-like protein